MKKILIFVAVITSILLTSCTSEFEIMSSDVPQTVLTAFQTKYPSIQNVEWEAEKADGHLTFEAAFKMDGKKKEACFKPDGTFIKEE